MTSPRKKKLAKAGLASSIGSCGAAINNGNGVSGSVLCPYDADGNVIFNQPCWGWQPEYQQWTEVDAKVLDDNLKYSAHQYSMVNTMAAGAGFGLLGGGYNFLGTATPSPEASNEWNYTANYKTDLLNDSILKKAMPDTIVGLVAQKGLTVYARSHFFDTYNIDPTGARLDYSLKKYYFGSARYGQSPYGGGKTAGSNQTDLSIFLGWAKEDGDGLFATASALRGALYDPSGQKAGYIPCVHSVGPVSELDVPGYNVNTIQLTLAESGSSTGSLHTMSASSIQFGVYGSLDCVSLNGTVSSPYSGSTVNFYSGGVGGWDTLFHTFGPSVNMLANADIDENPNYFRNFVNVPTGNFPINIALTQSNYEMNPKAGVMVLWTPWT